MDAQGILVSIIIGIMIIGYGYINFIFFPKVEKEKRDKEQNKK